MRDNPDAVMMFAAGFGTRMGALTADRPKPLIEVDGRPLIDHALDMALQIQPRVLVANVHYLPQMLETHLSDHPVLISHETPDILETGGGLRKALPMLGHGPVFTMNTDAIWHGPNPMELLQQAWDGERMDALLMCVDPSNAVGHNGSGDFLRLSSGAARRGPGLIYGGVQILKTEGLHQVEEESFSLNLFWNTMLDSGRLHVMTYPGKWCDVGSPEGITLAENMLRQDHD